MGRRKIIPRRSLVPVDVLHKRSFIDTVCLVLPERLPKESFRNLRVALYKEQRAKKRRYVLRRVPTANGYWIYKIYIHQPTVEALRLLKGAEDQVRARILEVHMALDLATATFGEAELLQEFIESRLLVSKWSRKLLARFHGTTYFNVNTRKGAEVVLYSDRKSKLSENLPCLHIEWREIGRKALRKASFESCEDLIGTNHRKFWEHRLALWTSPNFTKLSRSRNRKAGSRAATSIGNDSNKRAVSNLIRSSLSPSGAVVTNDLFVLLRRSKASYNKRPIRLFTKEPATWMLPSSENSMWADE